MSEKPANMLEALGTKFREAPQEVKDAAELLVMAIYADVRSETGNEKVHIARLLHLGLMQTQNAIFRMARGASEQGYVDGLANFIVQACAMGPPAMQARVYDGLMVRIAELWPSAQLAGEGAGKVQATQGSYHNQPIVFDTAEVSTLMIAMSMYRQAGPTADAFHQDAAVVFDVPPPFAPNDPLCERLVERIAATVVD